ncbi:MAG: hypothetical protein H6564_10305 [Lewinellaceae bacterium]|nr:hypothetical protein [Lewinellaceae bacterium]
MEAENTQGAGPALSDDKGLYEGLKNLEPWAIRHLGEQAGSLFSRLPGAGRISTQDREELINDTLVLVLSKLEQGLFEFQGVSPVAYAMAVAGKLLNNRLRKRHLPTVDIEGLAFLPDEEIQDYFEKKETERLLAALLGKLGDDCRQLIRLRYYEGVKDEQAVKERLTKYTTVDSLKNKRCRCLKKLSEIVKQQSHLFR